MERPMHFDAHAAWRSPSRTVLAIGAAVVLEAVAFYLVASGLATRVMTTIRDPVAIDVLKATPKVVRLPPVQLPSRFVKPSLPTVSRPVFDIRNQAEPDHIAVIPSAHPVVTLPGATTTSPGVKSVVGPTPPRGIAATHTQPPYPVLARRTGKEGTVVLDITVATDGGVQQVSIAKSTGDDGLDEAAMNWVKAHWRYQPSTRNGEPVVAQSEAQVVFSLK